MNRFIFFFLLIGSGITTSAQTYPQNYFRHPLAIRMELVSNFGELRTNHWHMGLDIRTQRRENLSVYASAEGYVGRVVVAPGGFGQAIYIHHPNGLSTLYAHMNAFYPALAAYVKQKQYENESWAVDLQLPPGMFPLKKGDYIGKSGNTGGSAGPHVHFEIRDTKTEKVLNPLLFNFPIADAVPPTINRLVMYDRNRSTFHQSPQSLSIKKTGGVYKLATPRTIKVGSDKISFAIGATDRFSNSTNPNGIYSARISMDGNPVAEFVHDSIDYNETRYMNAQIDYPWHARAGVYVQHVNPLPGAQKVAYNIYKDEGIIYLQDEEVHAIIIDVKDAKKNNSRIQFNIQYDSKLATSFSDENEKFAPNQVNIFEEDGFELYTEEGSLYDTAYVTYNFTNSTAATAVSGIHSFLSHHIPVHDSITVRIKPSRELSAEEADKVLIRNVSGKRITIQKARLQNGWLMARFRQFGTFQALIDETPPAINTPASNLTKSSSIVFTPTDNFNVIKSFRAELNGNWLMFTNDKGKRWIYRFDQKFPKGNHELKVRIEDAVGNVSEKVFKVRR